MLKSIYIKNYAVIREADIPFSDGLNIITGETGAGKSVLLGALSLTLGERADLSMLQSKQEKCVIETIFDRPNKQLQSLFEAYDLDWDERIVLRREITTSGKSRAFVNDTPVNLSVLKTLSAHLVNVHSQHETLALGQKDFQLQIVDHMAAAGALKANFEAVYNQYRQAENKLKQLEEKTHLIGKELDYKSFLLKEIEEASLGEQSVEEMEQEYQTLTHAGDIKQALHQVSALLENDQTSILGLLSDAIHPLASFQSVSDELRQLHDRLESVRIELNDLLSESTHIADRTEVDQEQLLYVEDLLNTANKLLKKHGVSDLNQLKEIQQQLEREVSSVEQLDQAIEAAKQACSRLKKDVQKAADKLTHSRKNAVHPLKAQMTTLLSMLGMPNATFEVEIQAIDWNQSGQDEVQFLFSANKGHVVQPLDKVASGGELSRFMLSVKSILAGTKRLPTLLFDEIDTGISGETAAKVGDMLASMSKDHQLICITHLPQIAAKGNHHLFIAKDETGAIAQTSVVKLDEQKRIQAIAKMLSGEIPSEAAIRNAKELLTHIN